MTKKIKKEPTIRQYEVTCPICKCEFEFDTTDASWSANAVYDPDCFGVPQRKKTIVNCRVECPICGTWIENKQKEIK